MIGIVAAVVGRRRLGAAAGAEGPLRPLVLGIPVVGDIAAKFATSQMARTLATLLGGGLPLVNALDIAARSIGNQYMARELDIVSARVREGASFAAALEAGRVFRRSPSRWRRWASPPARFRTC